MVQKIIELLKKYREQITYLIFGGLTTLISWGLYTALYYFAFGDDVCVMVNADGTPYTGR